MESGASVRNLTVEGEVIPAGTQTDVGGIVGQMVADITLCFSSGGLDELQTKLNALQSLINRAPDTAQLRADIGALQAADGVPEELLHLTLRFAARGKVLECDNYGAATADRSAGGIAGSGSRVRDCISMVEITDCTQLAGAVAGEVTGEYCGNRFVSDTLTGVTAVYRPYVTALAAGDTEDGRPALHAEGLFREPATRCRRFRPTPPTPRAAPPGCGRSRSRPSPP